VVTALANEQPLTDDFFLAQQKDPSFRKFVGELASSNSDNLFI
jgi:hypothetical protein